jgi:phosphoribosylamine--glycine ligase
MNVLVVGGGGREHAIAWKLAQDNAVDTVFVAPGNGGTAREAKCVNVDLPGDPAVSAEARQALLDLAQKTQAAVTIIGPEAPLEAGLADAFREKGLPVIGPGREAARLETSKVFSKAFMEKYGVRTARSRSFTEYEAALHYAEKHFRVDSPTPAQPLVIKADGLAAGKGVVVAANLNEAAAAIDSFMRAESLGNAGKTLLLEEFVDGREVSILAAVSVRPGTPGVMLPFESARDHKRRYDGGLGPNTGGMGAIAPAPDFSLTARQDFVARILKPTLRGMEEERMDYRGFIFFGLMIKDDHCSLLEYNVRLGDPETQAVLPLMDSSFIDLCRAIQDNTLGSVSLMWKPGAVCAPVAVAGESAGYPGYPGSYRKGDPIRVDAEKLKDVRLFAAGAAAGEGGSLVTAGGRVLALSAWGADAAEARRKAYDALGGVYFDGISFRTDIGV